jgi:hypothetical protein
MKVVTKAITTIIEKTAGEPAGSQTAAQLTGYRHHQYNYRVDPHAMSGDRADTGAKSRVRKEERQQ